MIQGNLARVPHVEAVFWLMFIVNINCVKNSKTTKKISTAALVLTLFLLIMKSLSPISYITAGCWFSFQACTEKAKKARKAQLSRKKQEMTRNNSTNLTLLMLGFPKKKGLEKFLILAFSSSLSSVHGADVYCSCSISCQRCFPS